MPYYSSVSVRQRKKDKKWFARLSYKEGGEWKTTDRLLKDAKGIRDAKKQADALKDKLNEQASLMPNVPSEKTLEDIFTEFLEHQLNNKKIQKSTYSNSLYYYKKYIKPYIGDYIFATIDRVVLQSWINQLYDLGLADNTIHTIYSRLRKVYNYYLDSGELLKDPFKGVDIPKKGKPKKTHLTQQQMDNVLTQLYANYNPHDAFYVGALLAYYAGLRRGEICGLRWRDIDFNGKTISIRTAVGVGQGLGDYTKDPKNDSSRRTIPLIPQLEKALLYRKEYIKAKDNWFVIGKEESFMRPQQFSRLFAEFVKQNNLVDYYGKKLTPHGLRHNFATFGIKQGVDIASLSLMMGHASRAITLDVYGDANTDAVLLASNKLAVSFKDESSLDLEEETDKAVEEIRQKLEK